MKLQLTPDGLALSRSKFFWFSAIVFLVAFCLREQFILMTHWEFPIRGDIKQYVSYAYNLAHWGTYSSVLPGNTAPAPDSYRGPGYSLFLAAMMVSRPEADSWYYAALHVQALLGAATVVMAMALARSWLSREASLGAGLLIAVWPHHIAATGTLLSELIFGFVLVLAAWATVKATQASKLGWGVLAGLAFGYAYLINPLTLFFPPLVAIVLWKWNRRTSLCLLLIPALVAAIWTGRNLSLPDVEVPGRASANFVEGSWPQFHAAWNYRLTDPAAAEIMRSIGVEERLLASAPSQGLKSVVMRMREDPIYYLRWYAFEKPYLLWDWDIRVGFGDVYFDRPQNSPLETNPVLHGLKTVLHDLIFPIFLLSGATAFLLVWRFWRVPKAHFAPLLVALLCIYVTCIHVIFQAEPRYSIPYRPFQILLLITGLCLAVAGLKKMRPKPVT